MVIKRWEINWQKKGIPCLDGSDESHRHSRDEYRIILKEGELFGKYSNVRERLKKIKIPEVSCFSDNYCTKYILQCLKSLRYRQRNGIPTVLIQVGDKVYAALR